MRCKYQTFNLSELLQFFVMFGPTLVWVGGEGEGKLGRFFSTTKSYFLQVKSMIPVGTLSKKSPRIYPFQRFLESRITGLKRREENSSPNDLGFIVFERFCFK
ncbi:hypothetical protein APS47_00010 [Leptospira kirschneri serovar Mozdok]|nr:hypothetical protein APS47_00010 [Leptospira kirschneri serovar Mozdok]